MQLDEEIKIDGVFLARHITYLAKANHMAVDEANRSNNTNKAQYHIGIIQGLSCLEEIIREYQIIKQKSAHYAGVPDETQGRSCGSGSTHSSGS